MAIDLPVVLLIAIAALFVGSSAARRAAEHADHVAGRRPVTDAARRGPLGALLDLIDESVAAYTVRSRLGLSTTTRSERRADAARAALVARADEIRQLRAGGATPVRPAHLVVAGRPPRPSEPVAATSVSPPRRGSRTLPFELVAAAVGLVLVVGLVVAIAPRGSSGGVLSATGVPGSTAPAIHTPTPSATPSPEPSAS
jgi:hypothetical protein